jgi:hypothetical protein
MPEGEASAVPGYQGSERSSAEIIVYPQTGEPFVFQGPTSQVTPIEFKGKFIYDTSHALQGLGTSKSMGAPSGSWYATFKPTRNKDAMGILEGINDDDWVDIVFRRHGKRYHVMRGIVDDIRESTRVGGSGATVRSITLSGRDFGAVWEKTNIWFSPLLDQQFVPGVNLQVFGGQQNIYGSPVDVANGFLIKMFQVLNGVGYAPWRLPSTIPKVGGQNFADVIASRFEVPPGATPYVYSNNPERIATNPNYLVTEGNLWNLAQEWSDPAFCELFADTLPPWSAGRQSEDEVATDQSEMKLVLRDRPFPTKDSVVAFSGRAGPWFSLPTHVIPTQMIGMSDLGRGGAERFNSFHFSPQLVQEILGGSVNDLMVPMWDKNSIGIHGIRRYDIMSHYATDLMGVASAQAIAAATGGNPTVLNMYALSEYQRRRLKDWYCLNPFFLSGSISLMRGFPWIHIGEKVRVIDIGSPDTDRYFYVEKVDHNWVFGATTKTTLGVTRGWKGTEDDLLKAIDDVGSGYTIPVPQ